MSRERGARERGAAGRWWLATALWSLLVFATVPVARTLQRTVQESLGREAFGWSVLGFVALAAIGALLALRRRGRPGLGPALAVGGVAAVFGAATLSLRDAPEEALHFVQYGVLGVLAWRALAPSLPDATSFAGATLVGGIVGLLDEGLQWATPLRVWGLRDVGLNLFAAGLVQVALAGGVAPELARRRPGPASVRRLCGIAALALALLAASLLNTPPRTAWLAERVPGLAGLRDRVMAEYGFLHEDPEVGRFRSRLDAEALHRADATRAEEVARVLDAYGGADYPRFLADHPSPADPFVHEARVHVFRRDHYLARAQGFEEGSPQRAEAAGVALGEQRILERHFGRTLAASRHALDPDVRARLEAEAAPGRDYESAVSVEVITRFREDHVVAAALLGLGGLLAIALVTRRP